MLNAIIATRLDLGGRVNAVGLKLGLLTKDQRTLSDRVKGTESTISEIQAQTKSLAKQVGDLTSRIKQLEWKLNDLESCSRHNNVPIVGLLQRAEVGNPTAFFDTWLSTPIVPEGLSPHFTVECIQRVPAVQPTPGHSLRPVVATLQNFGDRVTVLEAAQLLGLVTFENAQIFLC
ncbi:hypothetical protein NDU88_004780 [Pleurodeles waltl]|uniref:Uncharacterized protein n=1 Tax=Pleurodeles waltl TaxID=8319 RepID=A0AAV7TTJ6_PLEWA|nr:hypothetical protein NDU88_004780 [Pleurodeles waltl]